MANKTKSLLVSVFVFLFTSMFALDARVRSNNAFQQMRLFDEYGRIAWEDEKARLDNFAIQLLHEPDGIGYIFVCDGRDMCAGEAELRAMRAKRYIVERRGVPWNRVIWRKEGYCGEFNMMLQPVSRGVTFPYPFRGPTVSLAEVHVTSKCNARIARIKRSKW